MYQEYSAAPCMHLYMHQNLRNWVSSASSEVVSARLRVPDGEVSRSIFEF
jgi:hypothetical protein